MKKLLLLLLVIMCFIVSTAYAQIADNSKSNYQNQIGVATVNTNFRSKEMVLDAAGIENKARLINLRYDKNKGIIRLDSTELIEDDAPAAGVPEGYKMYTDHDSVAWVEDLKKGVVIKKIFEVNNPSAVSGRIVFKGIEVKGNTQPLYLSLNGETFVRPASRLAYPHARQYIDIFWDRWYFVDLPVEKLRKGRNELLMWTESDSTSWRILIALDKEFKRGSLTRTSPNRSMKSSDGGKTWSDSHLGPMNSVDGEYSIRMSLDHYLPSGEYISPLMDLVDGDEALKRNASDLKVSMWPELEEPAQTSARAFVRFGASPFIGDSSWTEWKPIERGKEYFLADKRYLQWRVELSTDDPLVTPGIKGLRITAAWEDHSPNRNTGLFASVINNGRIIPLSYPFTYENLNHPGLKKYREDHKLDQIIAGASSEFEVMMRLLNWAYRVPLTENDYSWNWNDVTIEPDQLTPRKRKNAKQDGGRKLNNGEYKVIINNAIPTSKSDMPKLNGPFFNGRRMKAMCLYPTQALIGALLSMGFQARHININSEGMSGHEVTEVWSNEFNKWIYLDPTVDSYFFNRETGVPLNVLEMHNLLVEQMPRVENWERPFVPDIGKDVISRIRIGMRQGNNPYSIKNYNNNIFPSLITMGHFKIIPRNDFLSHPLPVPESQGTTMWGWDGFLNWYDDAFPKRDEYQKYTNRSTDFYPPLNQAKVFLNETNKLGIINVVVEEFTPGGFESLLVKVNDGAWHTENKSSWNWRLRSGLNNVKVRTRNVRGILGPVSDINVTYNP
jgi:hypothetical protein